MINRKILIEGVLPLLETTSRLLYHDAEKQWFVNLRPNGGLRLSDCGLSVFYELGFDHWQFDLKDQAVSMANIIHLDRCLHWPWYWLQKQSQLKLFGSQEAMHLTLCGSFQIWMQQLVQRQHRSVSSQSF